MNSSVALNQNPTLAQINHQLMRFSLPVIPREKIQLVLAHADRNKLIASLNQLDDPTALEYVRSSLTAAQLLSANEGMNKPVWMAKPTMMTRAVINVTRTIC